MDVGNIHKGRSLFSQIFAFFLILESHIIRPRFLSWIYFILLLIPDVNGVILHQYLPRENATECSSWLYAIEQMPSLNFIEHNMLNLKKMLQTECFPLAYVCLYFIQMLINSFLCKFLFGYCWCYGKDTCWHVCRRRTGLNIWWHYPENNSFLSMTKTYFIINFTLKSTALQQTKKTFSVLRQQLWNHFGLLELFGYVCMHIILVHVLSNTVYDNGNESLKFI